MESDGERADVVQVKDELPSNAADASQAEIAEWSKLGMLPPGKGGRASSTRKQETLQIHHVGKGATDYEDLRSQRCSLRSDPGG